MRYRYSGAKKVALVIYRHTAWPLWGINTQRKLTTPDSPKRLQRQHAHKRHATPAPAHTTPAHFDLLCTACAPTSTHSNCFCVIWVCISPSSSSMQAVYTGGTSHEAAYERPADRPRQPGSLHIHAGRRRAKSQARAHTLLQLLGALEPA